MGGVGGDRDGQKDGCRDGWGAMGMERRTLGRLWGRMWLMWGNGDGQTDTGMDVGPDGVNDR